jgi:hypothetical protein
VSKLLQELSVDLALPQSAVEAILRSAPTRYKIFQIPKRRGGIRLIAQPARELKDIQRLLLERYLNVLPIHPAATAYVIGKNILSNAELHKDAKVLLKLDFKDFFLNIRPEDLRKTVGQFAPKLVNPLTGPGSRTRYSGRIPQLVGAVLRSELRRHPLFQTR